MKYTLCVYYDIMTVIGLDEGIELNFKSDKEAIEVVERILKQLGISLNPLIREVVLFGANGAIAQWYGEFKRVEQE